MCSRAEDVMTDKARAALEALFGPLGWGPGRSAGEVRPTDPLRLVRPDGGRYEAVSARWGFVPAGMGAAELKKYAMFNARIENVQDSRAFGAAFSTQRCVVPLSAFYEWPSVKGKRQKTRLVRPDGLPLLVAGLWNRCEGPQGTVESCTLITRPPTPDVAHVHDRMPALLLSGELSRWLHGTPQQALEAATSSWRPGVLGVSTC